MEEDWGVSGGAEASRQFGRPEERSYLLAECGDVGRFWEMWARRLAEVVLVVRRPDGRLVLQTKRFYPPNTYRLPTGGIWTGEDLLAAVRRETLEEMGLPAYIVRFLGVLHYHFRHCDEPMIRTSFVFLLDIGPGPLQPQDVSEQITEYREVPVGELPAVAQHLESLPGDWAIWGQFRALGHRFVADVLMRNS